EDPTGARALCGELAGQPVDGPCLGWGQCRAAVGEAGQWCERPRRRVQQVEVGLGGSKPGCELAGDRPQQCGLPTARRPDGQPMLSSSEVDDEVRVPLLLGQVEERDRQPAGPGLAAELINGG